MASTTSIMLRLTTEDPVVGVTYSLQDKANTPVGPVVSDGAPLSFDVPVKVAPGPKFTGDFVRREGPERRFVYIAIGQQAGDIATEWSRRVKVDIHTIPQGLLVRALAGAVLEARLPGRAKDGGPACATLAPIGGWMEARG